MRAVTSATAAAVLAIDSKSLGNLIARIGSEALPPGRQGVARRIPVAFLELLALSTELSDRLSLSASEAFALARRLLSGGGEHPPEPIAGAPERTASPSADFVGSVTLGDFLYLGVDLQRFRAELHARLTQAIESHVRPRRGRPRKPRGAVRGGRESIPGKVGRSKQAPGA